MPGCLHCRGIPFMNTPTCKTIQVISAQIANRKEHLCGSHCPLLSPLPLGVPAHGAVIPRICHPDCDHKWVELCEITVFVDQNDLNIGNFIWFKILSLTYSLIWTKLLNVFSFSLSCPVLYCFFTTKRYSFWEMLLMKVVVCLSFWASTVTIRKSPSSV